MHLPERVSGISKVLSLQPKRPDCWKPDKYPARFLTIRQFSASENYRIFF